MNVVKRKIDSLLHQVKLLEELVDQQQAFLNFQSAQHNLLVDFGVKREKEIIRLKRKITEQASSNKPCNVGNVVTVGNTDFVIFADQK